MGFFAIVGIIATFFIIKFFYDDYQRVSAEKHNQRILLALKYKAREYLPFIKQALDNSDFDKAIQYIQMAILNDPTELFYKEALKETIEAKGEYLYIKSNEEYHNGNIQKAYNYIVEACNTCPNNKEYISIYLDLKIRFLSL